MIELSTKEVYLMTIIIGLLLILVAWLAYDIGHTDGMIYMGNEILRINFTKVFP